VVDDTVVGGGPLSTISSTACAATGSIMAANALDDDSRRRKNWCVTHDACLEPAKPRWRMAPPSPARARKVRLPKPGQARPRRNFRGPGWQCYAATSGGATYQA
jgi:hypothetical protein